MIKNSIFLLAFFYSLESSQAQNIISKNQNMTTMNTVEILSTASHIQGLEIRLLHKSSEKFDADPILILHGSSFPSALASDFKMDNISWMDQLAAHRHDVYALDFLGYGHSDRYPEMLNGSHKVVGRAASAVEDVDMTVEFILKKTGRGRVVLIAHSWGGTVAALYAGKFKDKISKLILFSAITNRNENSERDLVEGPYDEMTPTERISGMNSLAPANSERLLAADVFNKWGSEWLISDAAYNADSRKTVRFPSGPSQDIDDLLHNLPYYDPSQIIAPTLLVRGEWDKYPSNDDFKQLLNALKNASYKKYVVIENGTHVMHLEKARFALYEAVLSFIDSDNTGGAQQTEATTIPLM